MLPEPHAVPRVTLGMPIYNSQDSIRTALDSLLAQTFTDFELVISDNASTDQTEAICREYAARDPRIRYVRQPQNRGSTFNFNFVLAQARASDFFMWTCDDNLWDRTCLEKFVAVFERQKDASLVVSHYTIVDYVTKRELGRSLVVPSLLDNKRSNLLIRFLNPTPLLMYGLFRRTFLDEVVGQLRDFDFSDLYMTYQAAVAGKIYVVEDFLFHVGMKSQGRRPYSIAGDEIDYRTYFRRTLELIWTSFRGADRVSLVAIFCLLWSKTVRHTRRTIEEYDRKYPKEVAVKTYRAPESGASTP